MPISIAGSGTITGISAGGLPDDCITTAEIAANAVTYAKIGTTEQGQLCKAWVNFNGTSTVAIRASYNVSSITDNGTGDYTVNFTTALADQNYATQFTVRNDAITAFGWVTGIQSATDPTTTAVRLVVYRGSDGTARDTSIACVAIFR